MQGPRVRMMVAAPHAPSQWPRAGAVDAVGGGARMRPTVRIRLLGVALAATFLLMLPILMERPHLLAGGDMAVHVQFTRGLLEALRQGVLLPRWLADANYGLGGPVFIFYTPLAYYLSAFATWLTGSTVTGLNVAYALAGALSVLTFYGACRGLTSQG